MNDNIDKLLVKVNELIYSQLWRLGGIPHKPKVEDLEYLLQLVELIEKERG